MECNIYSKRNCYVHDDITVFNYNLYINYNFKMLK